MSDIPFGAQNLYDQMKTNMNRYFLLIACLQLIPTITPVPPLTTWLVRVRVRVCICV